MLWTWTCLNAKYIHTFSQMCNEIKIKIRITQKFIFNFQFLAEIGKRKNWQSKKDFFLYISFHFKSLLKSGFYKNILLSWLMGKVRAIYKSTYFIWQVVNGKILGYRDPRCKHENSSIYHKCYKNWDKVNEVRWVAMKLLEVTWSYK